MGMVWFLRETPRIGGDVVSDGGSRMSQGTEATPPGSA